MIGRSTQVLGRSTLLRPVTAGALVLCLAACSSGGDPAGSGSPTSSPSSPASASALPSSPSAAVSSAVSSAAPSTAASTPRSPVRGVGTPPTSPVSGTATNPTRIAAPPVLRSTCTSLTVRIIRGSAAAGREFAALQFTNTGRSSCVLHGYPSVTLLRAGKQIGTASQPSGTPTSTRRLAPGDTAESRLNDYTDCQAPLSDTIRVQVPGSSQISTGRGRLRACTLRVDPLGAPD